MNIWIFNHYAGTPSRHGGTRHHEMASFLVTKGINVTIFASSYSHAKRIETIKYDDNNYVFEFVDGVRYCWIKTPPYRNSIGRIRNMLSYTKNVIAVAKRSLQEEKVDLVIGSTVHPGAALAGYRISQYKNSKFFFEERDLWPQTFIDFGKISSKSPISTVLFRLEKFLYNKSDRIIVLFDKAVDYIESRGVNRKKVVHIPNGVNLSNFQDIKPSKVVDDMIQPLKGKFVVAYTGAIGEANHLHELLDLAEHTMNMQELKNVHFLVVGQGPMKFQLVKTAKEKKLNNITFADSIQKKDIPYLLNNINMTYISIMNSPLYKWGFSMNKIFDYMASGKPMLMHTEPELAGNYTKAPNVYVSNELKSIMSILNEKINADSEIEAQKSINMKKYVELNSWDNLGCILYNEILEVVDKKL